MTPFKAIKTTARAAVTALVIAAASLSAMPAQAAGDNLTFGFGFSDGGSGLSFFLGEGGSGFRRHGGGLDICMSNRQIARDLRGNGFEDITFVRERRNSVQVEAIRGRWVYSMWVDKCSGEVRRIERVRRIRSREGFSLEFNF